MTRRSAPARPRSAFYLCLIAAFSWLAAFLPAQALAKDNLDKPRVNLAKNGGFETVGANDLPKGWSLDEYSPGQTRVAVVADPDQAGNHYLEIDCQDEDDVKLFQRVELRPRRLYKISVRVKARIDNLGVKGANLSGIGLNETSHSVYNTQGRWQEIVVYGQSGPKQRSVEISLRLGGYYNTTSGYVAFDDFRMERVASLPKGAERINLYPGERKAASSSAMAQTPLFLFLFILAMAVLAFFLDRSGLAARLDAGRPARVFLLAILGLGLGLRLPFCFGGHGFGSDLATFYSWADQVFQSRLVFFYRDAKFADYPPLYMAVLYPIGLLRHLIPAFSKSPLADLLIRLPALACDVGLAVALYRYLSRRSGARRGLIAAAIFLLNPVTVMNSAVWGQVDSVFCLLIFLAIEAAVEGRDLRIGLLYALAILTKPQAFIFAPVFLCYLAVHRDWKRILTCLGSGLASLGLACLPFMISMGPGFPISLYVRTLSSYPYASVNAANIWGALGMNYAPIKSLCALGLSASAWGWIAVGAITLLAFSFFFMRRRRGGGEPYFEVALLLIVCVFAFGTKMHERYLYPAIALSLAAWANRRSMAMAVFAIYASLPHFLNLAMVYQANLDKTYTLSPSDPLFIVVSILTSVLAPLALGLSWRREDGFDRGLRPAAEQGTRLGALARAWAEPGRYPQISEQAPAPGRAELIGLGLLFAFSLALGLIGLGDFGAPNRGVQLPSGTVVNLDLGQARHVASLSYYSGICDSSFSLASSADGVEWEDLGDQEAGIYSWKSLRLGREARYLRLTVKSSKFWFLEMAVWPEGEGRPLSIQYLRANDAKGASLDAGALCDEPELAAREARYGNSMYFDEIYHARTAFEYIHKLPIYEWTHPPLGKIIISLSIRAFGMFPFAWRLPGALVGAFLPLLLYALAREIFPRRGLPLAMAWAYAFDFMRYTQTRISTVDVYVVFFVLLSFLGMTRYYLSAVAGKGRPNYAALGLSALAISLAMATKWNAVYAGLGLCLCFFLAYTIRLKRDIAEAKRTKAALVASSFGLAFYCVFLFVALPLAVYALSYLPTLGPGRGWTQVLAEQKNMFSYHSQLKATHSFSSQWYGWPWLSRPVWYFNASEMPQGLCSSISAHGNPILWWPSLIAAILGCFLAAWRRDLRPLPILAGFASQYLPWTLVPRLTFMYHYFPIMPFGLMAFYYCLDPLFAGRELSWARELGLKAKAKTKPRSGFLASARRGFLSVMARPGAWAWAYAALAALLFAWFLPVISGMTVPKAWVRSLTWFPWWHFTNL